MKQIVQPAYKLPKIVCLSDIKQNQISRCGVILNGWTKGVFLVLYSLLLFLDMIDRALNFSTGSQSQSYYFQFVPITLSVLSQETNIPSQETTYRFAIFRAQQQVDESKIPIQALFQQNNGVPELAIQSCRLNFNLASFNRLRKQEFVLRLFETDGSQQYDIADYTIDASAIVASFKESGQNRHQFTIFLSKTYGLKFQVYIEKTRVALEKSTKRFIVENDKLTTSVVKKEYKTMTPTKTNFDESESKASVSVTEQKVIAVPKNRKSPLPRFDDQSVKQSDKNDLVSQKSNGSKVPLIQTKYKAVSKRDAAAEIRLSGSQRLPTISANIQDSSDEPAKVNEGPELKQKLFLWIFMAVSAIIIYFAMHPNRKV